MVEAATVGDEGTLGIEASLAADATAAGEMLIQVPDTTADSSVRCTGGLRREAERPIHTGWHDP